MKLRLVGLAAALTGLFLVGVDPAVASVGDYANSIDQKCGASWFRAEVHYHHWFNGSSREQAYWIAVNRLGGGDSTSGGERLFYVAYWDAGSDPQRAQDKRTLLWNSAVDIAATSVSSEVYADWHTTGKASFGLVTDRSDLSCTLNFLYGRSD